jgi:hypothetical protein
VVCCVVSCVSLVKLLVISSMPLDKISTGLSPLSCSHHNILLFSDACPCPRSVFLILLTCHVCDSHSLFHSCHFLSFL